jgi:hypothetical protein
MTGSPAGNTHSVFFFLFLKPPSRAAEESFIRVHTITLARQRRRRVACLMHKRRRSRWTVARPGSWRSLDPARFRDAVCALLSIAALSAGSLEVTRGPENRRRHASMGPCSIQLHRRRKQAIHHPEKHAAQPLGTQNPVSRPGAWLPGSPSFSTVRSARQDRQTFGRAIPDARQFRPKIFSRQISGLPCDRIPPTSARRNV